MKKCLGRGLDSMKPMSLDAYRKLMPVPLEDEEQRLFVETVRMTYPKLLFFAVPNGGSRHPAEAAKLKRTGVSPGVPDLVFPIARGKYHGLFIEMKRRKGGVVSPEQLAWKKALEDEGYAVHIVAGADEAFTVLGGYLCIQK